MIFDTHAHYCDHQFDDDRDCLLSTFKENNIKYVTEVCASMDGVEDIISLISKYDFIYGALGVHPSDVSNLTEMDMETIANKSKHEKIVAIGEIGLDYHYDDGPSKELQEKWFIRQLHLARELNLPVIIHSREALNDTLEILKKEHSSDIGGVIHCYSYSAEICRDFLNMGFYIGVGGVVTYKNGRKLKEVVDMLPMDRILLETDCPYLSPTPHRGERNSSLFIPYIVSEIASIKGISEEEVMDITMKNALTMYKLS